MEESQPSSIPFPAPQIFKCILNKQESEIENSTRRLPRCIPYCILHENIIWLDLFANERNLTFADEMIASDKLNIFNTAVDCLDFLNVSSQRLNLSSTQAIYSIIVSGVYAINIKVIDQLLPYDSINQIYLILHESCYENLPDLFILNRKINVIYENLPDLFILNRKINVIYNNNPDVVMHQLCNDYSNFETFIQYNNELHKTKNDLSNSLSNNVLQENISPRIVPSYQWDINHNNNTRTATGEMPLQQTYRTNQMKEKKVNVTTNNTFSNVNCVRPHAELLPTNSKCSSMGVRSSSYQQMELIELPLPFSSQHSTDMLALKELEQIKENLMLLNQLVNEFQMDESTHDDRWYKQIEERAFQLMIRCDGLTDVGFEVRSLRSETIRKIQQLLTKLDLKVSAH